MALSYHLLELSKAISGKGQFFWKAYAKAFEVLIKSILLIFNINLICDCKLNLRIKLVYY